MKGYHCILVSADGSFYVKSTKVMAVTIGIANGMKFSAWKEVHQLNPIIHLMVESYRV